MNLDKTIHNIASHDDQRAFRDLFNLYYEKLYKIAIYFVRSEFLAEEVVSTVFVNLWETRSNLSTVKKIDYFLFTAVKRRSIDQLRKLKNDNVIPINAAVKKVALSLETGPEEEMIYHEFEAVVNNAINKLPPKCQLIYRMVKEDGLKYAEVAEVLDLSVKTIEFHIGKGLKSIRSALDHHLSYTEQIAKKSQGKM